MSPALFSEMAVDPHVSVTCVHGVAALEQYAPEIDRLNREMIRPNPFLSSAFLKTYALHCEDAEASEERLYLIREGRRLIGCAPLRRTADGSRFGLARITGWRSHRVSLMAPRDTELPGVLAAPADEMCVVSALMRYLCDSEPGWDMVELAGQQPGKSLHQAAHAMSGWRFRARDIEVEPYNDIEISWNDLHDYFGSLAKKMRSNVSRQARRLFAAGQVEFILAEGADAATCWFDVYCELESRSWKNGTAASIRRHPHRIGFFRNIVAGKGGLDPSFIGVVLDGSLIAGLILGSNATASPGNHGAWCLEMAFDESRSELGPAQALLLLAMGRAIEHGHRHLSFMQNFSYFKHRWGARPVHVVNVALTRRATMRSLVSAMRNRTKVDRGRAGPAMSGPHTVAGPERIRALTSLALATSPSVRRLDRHAASTWLPFAVE